MNTSQIVEEERKEEEEQTVVRLGSVPLCPAPRHLENLATNVDSARRFLHRLFCTHPGGVVNEGALLLVRNHHGLDFAKGIKVVPEVSLRDTRLHPREEDGGDGLVFGGALLRQLV